MSIKNTVHVNYYAILREQRGVSDESVETEAITADELYSELATMCRSLLTSAWKLSFSSAAFSFVSVPIVRSTDRSCRGARWPNFWGALVCEPYVAAMRAFKGR